MSIPRPPDTGPKSARDAYERGLVLMEKGDMRSARLALTEALALDSTHARAYYQLGNCLRLLGDVGAEKALRTAIQWDGGLQEAYISLAYLYRGQGRGAEAAAALLALAGKRQGDWALQLQLADLLGDMDRPMEAASIYEACLRHDPRLARAHAKLGLAYQKLGRFQEAEQALLAAIENDPDSDAAYLRLAHTRRWRSEDAAVTEKLEAALSRPGLTRDTRVCVHFALGKMYDDLGLYDRAFGHFRQGNTLWHAQVPFDRQALTEYVAVVKRICVPELFKPSAPETAPGPIPVFVVGMLRSGTTLVERILASHPEVMGLGETEMVDALAERASAMTGRPYPDCLAKLTAREAGTLAADFRSGWPAEASKAARITDKNPLNFLHLGLIARVFPGAPILHCVRDPLDSCLSVYFQHFAHVRNNYAYDLGDIAFFYQRYAELIAHWRKVLPAPIHEVSYERLVQEPEVESRALVAAAGLAWHPNCLKPHEHAAGISTASLWQARQPINAGSVGRWRHYATHLDGLRRDLAAT